MSVHIAAVTVALVILCDKKVTGIVKVFKGGAGLVYVRLTY